MTFFADGAERIPARRPPGDLEGIGGGLYAGAAITMMETDANWHAQGTIGDVEEERLREIFDDLPSEQVEAIRERWRNSSTAKERVTDDFLLRHPTTRRALLDVAREQGVNVDLSQEGIEQTANERLRAEYDEFQAALAMSPSPLVSGFAGGVVGSTLDIRNIPFLALGGGGGSILRAMGREAALNVAAETATLGSQFEMAERLDLEDPNIIQNLTMAAAGGAAIGGLVEAIPRAAKLLRNVKGRNEVPSNVEPTAVDRVEDALVGRAPFFEDVARDIEAEARIEANPLNPDRAPLYDDAGPRRPVTQAIRAQVKIHPDGDAASELRALGVTAKSYPGLFSRQGVMDVDALVADEFPELDGLVPRAADRDAPGGSYFDREALLATIADEARGVRPARAVEPPQELPPQKADLVIDTEEADLFGDRDEFVSQTLNPWLHRNGLHEVLTPAEMDEMRAILAERGGSAQGLVDRIIERQIAHAETAGNDATAFADVGPGAGGAGRGDQRSAGAGVREGDGDVVPDLSADRAGLEQSVGDVANASEYQFQRMADLRDQVEAEGDLEVDFGDGPRSMSSVLDELDADQDFADIAALCGARRVAE